MPLVGNETVASKYVFGDAHQRIKRECFIANLLVRLHFITEIISRTGIGPWDPRTHGVGETRGGDGTVAL